MKRFEVSGQIVDIVSGRIFAGVVTVEDGKILSVKPTDESVDAQYIMPGFIDAHVHVESSMLIPSEFARLAVTHGTVATVSDPHEIANVLGLEGVRYMLKNAEQVPFKFYFGAPSCVPATSFETAGATLPVEDIRILFQEDKLKYLSEMMNYPGVLARNPLVMDKIEAAKAFGVPVDGHAPGLKGADAERYISAGISTDHECFSLEEALDKLKFGMKIIIREGSAAKNYNALHPVIASHPSKVMFCSDDKHPDELVQGHINQLVRRSVINHGYDMMDVLRCASLNPIKHYKLDVGLLQEGDPADFIIVDNLTDFNVKQTYVNGVLVSEKGRALIPSVSSSVINNFDIPLQEDRDFTFPAKGEMIQVIVALDGQLTTKKQVVKAKIKDECYVSDTERDILKLVVVNRYHAATCAKAFIHGFGLQEGALASCIAHDSHNIIAVGVDDHYICMAVDAIIKNKGGISVSRNGVAEILPLPIAGIMTNQDGYSVAKEYAELDRMAKQLGSKLHAPFMTLSFMALLVIPALKLSDKGLFDVESFGFTPYALEHSN